MSEYVIETSGLTKQYDGKAGCRDISLKVPGGIVFGFLGPNGAGKSTFVRTMLGLLQPTGGSAQMLGRPIGDVEIRKRVGYLPELFRYQDWLTGRQLLETHADLARVPRSQRKEQIDQLIERVGLTGRENEKIRGYSKGMQQRIGIACALIGDPDLIFLDEPTSALDPIGRLEVRNLISDLRQSGKTIFLNSHLLAEVENLCDQVAIIHKSELIVQGDWRSLSEVKTQVEIRIDQMTPRLGEIALHIEQLEYHRPDGTSRWLLQLAGEDGIPDLVNFLSGQGIRLYELTPRQPHLEDVFMHWIERKEREYENDRLAVL